MDHQKKQRLRPKLKRFVRAFSFYLMMGAGVSTAQAETTSIADQKAWETEFSENAHMLEIGERMRARFYSSLEDALNNHWVAVTLSGWIVPTNLAPLDQQQAIVVMVQDENKDRKHLYQTLAEHHNKTHTHLIQQEFAGSWMEAVQHQPWLIKNSSGTIVSLQSLS